MPPSQASFTSSVPDSSALAAGPSAAEVSVAGIAFASAPDTAVDVLIGGHRAWSFQPRRDGTGTGRARFVAWHDRLRPFLDGRAHVVVREHVSGRILADTYLQFGVSVAEVRICDEAGHPLALDKMHRLLRSFAEPDDARLELLMKSAMAALDLLSDKGGVPAFVAFGALLGAVRGGRLIAHDDDIDLAYVSAYTSPADVARESYQLERLFVANGWQTWRFSANDFKVLVDGIDDDARWIDIFGAFTTEGVLYLMPTVAAPQDEVTLLPLRTIELEGYPLPAPADPESLLSATYGPGWRVPDPSFRFAVPQHVERKLDGWMRNAIENRGHWFPFYESSEAANVPSTPSPFARWFAEQEHTGLVVDVGCGTGRDSLWLAGQGFAVRGLDYAPPAVALARQAAAERAVDARFDVLNLYDSRHVLAMGATLSHTEGPVFLYGRFLLHALTDLGRKHLWLLARMSMRNGRRFYLEFRAAAPHLPEFEFGEHYRQHLNPDRIAEEIERMGGQIEDRVDGYGLAVYKNEDPYVSRMVATWR
jgi:SAM-dependent methyltransferase